MQRPNQKPLIGPKFCDQACSGLNLNLLRFGRGEGRGVIGRGERAMQARAIFSGFPGAAVVAVVDAALGGINEDNGSSSDVIGPSASLESLEESRGEGRGVIGRGERAMRGSSSDVIGPNTKG